MQATLLIATMSPRKRREAVVNLRRLDAKMVTPTDLGLHAVPTRQGSSYLERAEITAHAYCRLSSLITVAEYSGLEVDALGSQPGLDSWTFAPGQRHTDTENQAYLLHCLSAYPRPWTARFRSVVVVADNTWGPIRYHNFEGEVRGEIAPAPRGVNGFGYDAVFLIPELGRTLAELQEADYYKVSARSAAFRAAFAVLDDVL